MFSISAAALYEAWRADAILIYYCHMQEDIVAQGFELMLYGMGTVVVFLALLIATTTLMSRVVGRYFPEAEAVAVTRAPATTAPISKAGAEAELVAVISAAVQQHRKKHSQQGK